MAQSSPPALLEVALGVPFQRVHLQAHEQVSMSPWQWRECT